MTFLRGLQRALYLASRSTGDVRAIQRGTYGKRLVRRAVNRRVGRVENRLFR